MTDHDPFGPAAGIDDPFGPADDDKTVQYTRGAAPDPEAIDADDDKTVQYDRSASAGPTPTPGAEDKTVQYSTGQPTPTSEVPPPIWVSMAKHDAAAPPPASGARPPSQPWQQPATPPGWFPPMPAAPDTSNRRLWLFGGVAAALVVIVVVITIIVGVVKSNVGHTEGLTTAAPSASPLTTNPSTTSESPSTTTSTPPTSLGPDDLEGLLESASDVSDRLESPGMTASPVSTDLIAGITVTPASCAGAWTPGLSDTYAGSGFTGAALQMVRDPGQNNHQVNQAIVSFADDSAAKAFYDQQVAAWKSCNFQQLSASAPGAPTVTGNAAASADTEGTTDMLILVDNWPGGGAIQCQRAITNRINVIVDVLACSPSVGSGGWTIARDIGEKITGSR